MGTDTTTTSPTEQPSWLEIEAATRLTATKKKVANKQWSLAVNTAVAVFILTMTLMLILIGGRMGASSAVCIKATTEINLGRAESKALKPQSLLGGLLAPGFDEQSCLSRYQSMFYRKNMSQSPSQYLIKRLREHEALQRRCGPGSEPYKRASEQLKTKQRGSSSNNDCNYLVVTPYNGLGNKIIAIVSAFLYAVLTNRVLLVDRCQSLADIFCEPFQETSWLLPTDFPLENYTELSSEASESYGTLVQNITKVSELSYVYVNVDHAGSKYDKLFYCDDHREFLGRVPWVVIRSDVYFAPAFFLNPTYEEELDRLFPRKDSVFFLLSRYLLHPTNDVWGLVTRFYDSYLKSSNEKLGIQIRVFDGDDPMQYIMDQILACTSQEHLLPEVVSTPAPLLQTAGARRSKAVLTTGLNSWYYENIRERYWEWATATGEVVSVHQPSHEGHQHYGHSAHDMKALAEMYLLSMTDTIVTSGWSTFGYVAQGLGGLKPWIMFKPENRTAPDPPCRRAMSMEPCFMFAPFYDCKAKQDADTGMLVPHVRNCEDLRWAIKLVDPSEQET